MANTIFFGSVGIFDSSKETFDSYFERFEMFFLANGLTDPSSVDAIALASIQERRKAIFLTEVGPDVYTTLSNLLVPQKPRDQTLADIVACLKNYYNPAPLEISESFHFNKRDQKAGESVSDYMLALKKVSMNCNFGEFLNRALRDRFVCGLLDVHIQSKLLNRENLDFKSACQTALAMEMATQKSQEMRPIAEASSHSVLKVEKIGGTARKINCFRCGRNHVSAECPHKDVICFKCANPGHFARFCKFKKKSMNQHKSNSVNCVVEFEADSDEALSIHSVVSAVSGGDKQSYCVTMQIGDKPTIMQVDTAADFSIMSKCTYDNNFTQFVLKPKSVR